MKTKPTCILFFMGIVMFFRLPAQDFKEDYRRLQNNFLHLQNFYCEVKVMMYEHLSSVNPQVLISTIKKQGNNYICVTGKTTTLTNENCSLQINEQEKQILYMPKSGKNKDEVPDQAWSAILDSALKKKNDSVVFGGITANQKKYTIYTSKELIMRTEMYMDQNTQAISRLVYYYKPGKQTSIEKVEIEYDKMNRSPSFSEAEFSEKKYVTSTGKMVKPTNTFANYRITVTDPEDRD